MKSIFNVLIIILLSNSLLGQAGSDGPDPLVKSEFIYLIDEVSFPSCHASTIEETEDGLVAAWFGGTSEKNPDVGIWLSRFTDGEWTSPVEVVNGVESEKKRYPTWNPVLFQPVDEPLMLFYKVGPSPSKWWGMITRSDDAGKTWSLPEKMGKGPFDHLLGPIKNKPIQLKDGTIIAPSSSEKKDKWRVHFELSKDMGQTWEVVGPINDGIEFDAIQPSILFYPDDKLQVLCRTKQGVISQSWSEDQGRTWSPMEATMLPNPNSGTDAVTLEDGRQVLVYNHIIPSQTWGSRSKLNMAVSTDGITWSAAVSLEDDADPDSEYSYPAVIQTSDGMIHVTYTWNRKMIKHVVIDPSRIQPRAIVNGAWPEFSYCSQPLLDLQVNEAEKRVDVMIEDELFTSYIYPDKLKKPVLWPVMSPAGNMLTRSFPLINKEGDRSDHPHHVGLWLNYGNVNGLDFWNNSEAIAPEKREDYGTIYHRSIEKAESGKGNALLVTTSDWKSPDQTVLLEEQTSFNFSTSGDMRIIDRTTTLKAVIDEVKFTDNKEGMFAIRVARELELPSQNPTELLDSHGKVTRVEKMDNTLVKGNYRSAEGVEGKEVWGTRCRWMKLSSQIEGEEVAIVIIDHPSNVGYPTYWHARDYGLFAANTLGQKVFSDGKNELNFSMKKGESVTFKYRLVVAGEKLTDSQINQLADEYSKQ